MYFRILKKKPLVGPILGICLLFFCACSIEPTVPATVPADRYSLEVRVVDEPLNVRARPSINAPILGTLPIGATIMVDPAEYHLADGYIWHKHRRGWSAMSGQSGWSGAFVGVVSTPDTDRMARPLFETFPVNMELIDWVQPFGDTVFSRLYGSLHRYGYAGGQHGGLDFGIDAPRSVRVKAGVDGVVVAKTANAFVIQSGRLYRITYQHLERLANLRYGDEVEPNSTLGFISLDEFSPDNLHVHIEVLYHGEFLVNPAELMLPINWERYELSGYHAEAEYQDPMDQPPIRRR